MGQRSAVYEDIVTHWTGNRVLDLQHYFLTPLQEEADDVWHQEAVRRYCLSERQQAKR